MLSILVGVAAGALAGIVLSALRQNSTAGVAILTVVGGATAGGLFWAANTYAPPALLASVSDTELFLASLFGGLVAGWIGSAITEKAASLILD